MSAGCPPKPLRELLAGASAHRIAAQCRGDGLEPVEWPSRRCVENRVIGPGPDLRQIACDDGGAERQRLDDRQAEPFGGGRKQERQSRFASCAGWSCGRRSDDADGVAKGRARNSLSQRADVVAVEPPDENQAEFLSRWATARSKMSTRPITPFRGSNAPTYTRCDPRAGSGVSRASSASASVSWPHPKRTTCASRCMRLRIALALCSVDVKIVASTVGARQKPRASPFASRRARGAGA